MAHVESFHNNRTWVDKESYDAVVRERDEWRNRNEALWRTKQAQIDQLTEELSAAQRRVEEEQAIAEHNLAELHEAEARVTTLQQQLTTLRDENQALEERNTFIHAELTKWLNKHDALRRALQAVVDAHDSPAWTGSPAMKQAKQALTDLAPRGGAIMLHWTTEKPQVPGWYWWARDKRLGLIDVLEIKADPKQGGRLFARTRISEDDEWLDDMLGEFAGPLPAPAPSVSTPVEVPRNGGAGTENVTLTSAGTNNSLPEPAPGQEAT